MTSFLELYKLIPGFHELCLLFYRSWAFSMKLIFVPRAGFSKLGFYKSMRIFVRRLPAFLKPNKVIIDDVHHCYSLQKMVSLFEDLFGPYIVNIFNFQPDWKRIRDTLLDHELGEVAIGDLTDDGTYDRAKKDRMELETYQRYIDDFPSNVRVRHLEDFKSFQENKSLEYCFDKAEFILMNGFLHRYGIDGSMKLKGKKLSDQDKKYCLITGSDRPVDNIYAHFLDITRDNPYRPFFIGVIEAMYEIEYGGVPLCIRNLY